MSNYILKLHVESFIPNVNTAKSIKNYIKFTIPSMCCCSDCYPIMILLYACVLTTSCNPPRVFVTQSSQPVPASSLTNAYARQGSWTEHALSQYAGVGRLGTGSKRQFSRNSFSFCAFIGKFNPSMSKLDESAISYVALMKGCVLRTQYSHETVFISVIINLEYK